jgi:hypothetical protein
MFTMLSRSNSALEAAANDRPEAFFPASGLTSGLTPLKPNRLTQMLDPLRNWIDGIEVSNPETARLLCKLIPSQCPFERDVVLFGQKLMHIPPMCKINPLFDQLVGLRFRSLCYLVDECGETVV